MRPILAVDQHGYGCPTHAVFRSQVFLLLARLISSPYLTNVGLGKSSVTISLTPVRCAVPNPVSLILSWRTVRKVGHIVDQFPLRAVSSLQTGRPGTKEGMGHKGVNHVVSCDTLLVGKADVPASPPMNGAIGNAMLAHHSSGSQPGISGAGTGPPPDSSVQCSDSSEGGDLVQPLVALNGQPLLHEVHSSPRFYFGWMES